eukprot:s202_g27.t2
MRVLFFLASAVTAMAFVPPVSTRPHEALKAAPVMGGAAEEPTQSTGFCLALGASVGYAAAAMGAVSRQDPGGTLVAISVGSPINSSASGDGLQDEALSSQVPTESDQSSSHREFKRSDGPSSGTSTVFSLDSTAVASTMGSTGVPSGCGIHDADSGSSSDFCIPGLRGDAEASDGQTSTHNLSMFEAHEAGVCRPCHFFHTRGIGCILGDDCTFCHFCSKSKAMASKRRVKYEDRRRRRREQQRSG